MNTFFNLKKAFFVFIWFLIPWIRIAQNTNKLWRHKFPMNDFAQKCYSLAKIGKQHSSGFNENEHNHCRHIIGINISNTNIILDIYSLSIFTTVILIVPHYYFLINDLSAALLMPDMINSSKKKSFLCNILQINTFDIYMQIEKLSAQSWDILYQIYFEIIMSYVISGGDSAFQA